MPTSKYFSELNELFFEPNFWDFLGKANSDYFQIHDYPRWSNMDALGDSFSLTLTQWKNKAEKNIHFKNFILERITNPIYKSWKSFGDEAPTEISLQEFKNELYQLKPLIQRTDYLKPVAREVIELLNRIAIHYNAAIPIDYTSESGNVTMPYTPLKWNANINILATLFYDLRKKQLPNNSVYIDADDKQIIEFIIRNFVDKNGKPLEYNTIKTIFQPSKPEKRANSKNKINIDILPIDSK